MWAIIEHGEHSSLEVSGLEVLIGESGVAGSEVLGLLEVSSHDGESGHALVEGGSNVRSVLIGRSSAEGSEVEGEGWASVLVKLEH